MMVSGQLLENDVILFPEKVLCFSIKVRISCVKVRVNENTCKYVFGQTSMFIPLQGCKQTFLVTKV